MGDFFLLYLYYSLKVLNTLGTQAVYIYRVCFDVINTSFKYYVKIAPVLLLLFLFYI